MISLQLFTEEPLVQEINALQNFLNSLQEEQQVREAFNRSDPSRTSIQIVEDDDFFQESLSRELMEERLTYIHNRQRLSSLSQEIEAKRIYIQELKEKLLHDRRNLVEAEYPEFLKNRPALFEKLKALDQNGYKTEMHQHWFTYLRSNLATHERMLKDVSSDPNSLTSPLGIQYGIVHYYTELLYAIDQHERYTA